METADGTPPTTPPVPPVTPPPGPVVALRGEPAAGMLLLRVPVAAAVAVVTAALAAAVLVPAGLWRPAVALPVVLVGLALAVRLALTVPARPVPVWSALTCAAVAAAHGVWAALTHAEHVVLRRDSGSYALYTQWIATRHDLPVDARLDAFGGPGVLDVPGFTLASPAFYQVLQGPAGDATGAHVVPQFLVGAPALWSFGWWAGGWPGALVVPALVSAFAVLAFAGLAARVVGPRWAPLAAGALALCFPVLHVARSTYSEAPALLLVAVAASLAVDATAAGRAPDVARRLALLAGAVLGLAGLVRVDALREVALVLPACAVLALRGHPAARPLASGAVGGVAVSAVAALVLSRPYLGSIAASLVPLVGAFVVLALGSLAAVALGRRRAGRPVLPAAVRARLPLAAGAAVALVGLVLASRPLWLVVRQDPDDPGARYVRGLQLGQGLPLDGGRTYAENSLGWVSWWTGPVTVVLAWAALATAAVVAVRWFLGSAAIPTPTPSPSSGALSLSSGVFSRDKAPEDGEKGVVGGLAGGAGGGAGGDGGRQRAGGVPRWFVPRWFVPWLVGLGSLVLTLYRPGITPDHPWADRRLVPVVLPVVVLAATAAVAVTVRWARRRLPVTAFVAVAVVTVGAVLVPAALAVRPLAAVRTERGEVAAVGTVCAALRPGDVVLAVDPRGANEWPQVVRGVCDRPAAALQVPRRATAEQLTATRAAVGDVARRVAGATVDGRPGRLVLLASGGDVPGDVTLRALGADPAALAAPAVSLTTVEDARLLTRRPSGVIALTVEVWLAPAPG